MSKSTLIKLTENAKLNSLPYQYYAQKQNGYFSWGFDNLYPDKILELIEKSPTHAAIIRTKINMLDDFEILGTEEELALFNQYSSKPLDQTVLGVINDYVIFNQFILKVKPTQSIYNYLSHVPVSNVRVGSNLNEELQPTSFVFSPDWGKRKSSTNKQTIYPVFKKDIDTDSYYRYSVTLNNDIYNTPSYASAINSILLEDEMSKFALSNTLNGWAPRLMITIFGEYSEDEQDDIVNRLEREFRGSDNAGKAVLLFAASEAEATKIEAINYNLNDNSYIAIVENNRQMILSAHQVTNPAIAGLATNNGFDNASVIQTAYQIYDDTIISSMRKVIESELNKMLSESGWGLQIKMNPIKLKVNQSEQI